MPIYVTQTYELITHESAEEGEAAETDILFSGQPYTFRELVDLMRDHPEPSCSRFGDRDGRVWFSSYPDQDFRTGSWDSTAIHLATPDDSRAARYWIKAARIAHSR